MITSKDNQHLKRARALQTKKGRESHHAFMIEGKRALSEAPKEDVIQVLLREDQDIESYQDYAVEVVASHLFNDISDTQHSQGVAAIVQLKERSLPGAQEEGAYLYLDQIQDPGNMGTILRSARAFGVKGVFCAKGTTDPHAPKAVRASMGAIHHVPIWKNIEIDMVPGTKILATMHEGVPLRKFTAPDTLCVVLGNEGSGVRGEIASACDEIVHIPMLQGAESLNVAMAASIVLYELYVR